MSDWWDPSGNLDSINPWGVGLLALGVAFSLLAKPFSRLWPEKNRVLVALLTRLAGLLLVIVGFIAAIYA